MTKEKRSLLLHLNHMQYKCEPIVLCKNGVFSNNSFFTNYGFIIRMYPTRLFIGNISL